MKFVAPLLFLILSLTCSAQVLAVDTTRTSVIIDADYDIKNDTIALDEIVISKEKLDPEAQKQFRVLQNRVYRVYPYAQLAAERLVLLHKGMASLNTQKEKKRYFKIVENYLTQEFEAKLKKLSRSQGRILVKLIHRQTGSTTFELIKNLKSGWKAFWSNTTASIFDIDLKSKYAPYQVNEDYLIETILQEAFENGRLQNHPSTNPIDIDRLNTLWRTKSENPSLP
ncbi:DUF4294 domain-containing protein [Flavobacterium crassostreae]|uniref:DUF4294 domain-containing protein n=1 Tax=Flavobacterium crassostreae TaxID=1763534 RepID=A0A1B9DKS5_9FLAO|nr:DUF4294 domain-containing protein [Flavobacterium crassostreae]OCB70243.1 hypothetical protein LPBF_12435 [Flavobacterium crassostreae]